MSVEADLEMSQFTRLLASMIRAGRGADDSVTLDVWSACASGDMAAVRRRLDYGFDVDSRLNKDGDTALTKSIMSGRQDLALKLLDWGANPELALFNGRTPLITAAGCGYRRVVEGLLDYGADINAQMCNGSTALMYAVGKNQIAVARLLISKGADLSLQDREGWTVWDYAAKFGVDMAELMCSRVSKEDELKDRARFLVSVHQSVIGIVVDGPVEGCRFICRDSLEDASSLIRQRWDSVTSEVRKEGRLFVGFAEIKGEEGGRILLKNNSELESVGGLCDLLQNLCGVKIMPMRVLRTVGQNDWCLGWCFNADEINCLLGRFPSVVYSSGWKLPSRQIYEDVQVMMQQLYNNRG